MRRLLLCTDLDRTLIPNGTQPESPQAKKLFGQLVARNDIILVYVTGRHRALIEQAIQEYDLPVPDYAVGDVGATIYQVDNSDWELWADWQQQLSRHWCLPIVDQLKSYISGMPEFTLQEVEKQNQFKVSYYVPLSAEVVGLSDRLESEMAKLEMRANLIWSVSEVEGVRLLDILPPNANKLHAIRHIMQCRQVQKLDTVFAGDSGNDKEVLRSEIQSVLVANAAPEMKQWAFENGDDTLYIAQGGVWGLNGNYRSGILEGACYFWPNVRKWMQELHSQGGI
jgi:sucrose-6F-phosphate phosphohydrolase